MASRINTLLALMLMATTAPAQELKQQAAAIFAARCAACHPSKSEAWDAKDLKSASAIEGQILDAIAADTMPPGNAVKLTEAEKKTIRDWFAAKPAVTPTATAAEKTQAPAEQKPRQFLDDAWVRRAIAGDTQRRGDTIYLSLANLWNVGLTVPEMRNAQGAVSKAINLLSAAPNIVVPRKVDTTGIVLGFDLSSIGRTEQFAADLLREYPYAERTQGFMRGDWFVSRSLSAPLYYRLVGTPGSLRDLDAALSIDRQRFVNNNIVARAGISNSKVAFHNRIVELAPSRTGTARLTYDTQNEERDRRLLTNPLGPIDNQNRFGARAFRHDAAEYIYDLPNGLHGYAAFNGQGQRQDKVPENIASDPNQYSGTTAIVPGISCVACHQKGTQTAVSDEVLKGAPLFSVAEAAKVGELYAAKENFTAALERGSATFLAASAKATEPFKSIPEPIGPLALEYNKPLDLSAVARESNLTESEVRNAILADDTLQAQGLRPLTEGQTITRATFESVEAGTSPALRIGQLVGRR